MKTLFFSLCIAVLTLTSSCSNPPFEVNVMTFNIRLDHAGDSLNNWKYRKDNAAKAILFYDADIVGAQEVLFNQLNDLKASLPQYNSIGVGREDGAEKGEFSPIFYKKDRFSAIESGTFWLSETPEKAGSKGWDAACERVATWARLKDNSTGKEVFVMNTHLDHMGQIARLEGVKLLITKAKSLSNGLPIVLTGDFNATPDTEVIKSITKNKDNNILADSKATADIKYGPNWSFHDFGRIPFAERPLIDYIFASPSIKVLKYGVLAETIDECFLSDHAPVLAKLSIKY